MGTPGHRSALRAYVFAVVTLGAGAIALSFAHVAATPRPFECLLFAGCAMLTTKFRLKFASVSASISVSDTFFITSALLFGPAPATIALAVDSAVMSLRLHHRWHRVAFNAVAPAVSLWAAAHLFFVVAGIPPLAIAAAPTAVLAGPVLLLAATYFVLNSGLTALAVALEKGDGPLATWRRHFMWLGVGYFAAGSVALCLTILINQVGITALAMVLPLVAIFHLTLRASFGRLEDAKRHVADIDRLYVSTVETLAMAIDAKDDVTHSHVRRVQRYALGLARAVGISDEPTLKAIEAAALLHDTGKLAVPEHILNKPGKLTPAEFDQMKLHVDVGADILSGIEFPYPVVPIVRCHHENWDGSGYPRGIAGDEIPVGARILSVVDCYDALTSDRPYRRRLSSGAALEILHERRGTMYDPRVVDAFAALHAELTSQRPATAEVDHAAFRHISRAAAPEFATSVALPPQDAIRAAFASLARVVTVGASAADVLSLATSLIPHTRSNVTTCWYLYDREVDQLRLGHATGPAARIADGLCIPIGDRLSGWVGAQRRPALNSDPALDLGDRAGDPGTPLRSCVSIPLADGPTLAGVLTIYSPDENAFTADDVQRLQAIAPHAATALAAVWRHDAPAGTSVATHVAPRMSATIH